MTQQLDYGDEVYFITDEDSLAYMVTGFLMRQSSRMVLLSHCGVEVMAYDIEITKDMNKL